jgi:chaperonin cofactor prefoldin
MSPPFPSPNLPSPNWNTVPFYNSTLADPASGNVGNPWNYYLLSVGARAAYVSSLNQSTLQLQNDVSTLQSQVVTIQEQITTLQGQVATLQSQVATLQGQVSTLQGQVTTLQGQVATLQGQVTHLLTKTNEAGSHNGTDKTVTAVGMAGIAVTFTPTTDARGLFLFGTNVQMSTGGGTSTIAVRFGTGTPPILGDALTGTVVSSNSVIAINEFTAITLSGILTGLVPGTTYWLDVGVSAISGGNLALNNNTTQVIGLIDPN